MMMHILRRFLRNTDATAAVEAAIFAPIFLLFTVGIADLGSEMFVQMSVNAATQAGAAYAVIYSGSTCALLTVTCQNGINAAMNDATADASFCTGTVCAAEIRGCADGSPKCITVSVSYPFTPIIPRIYSWAIPTKILSTTTVRVL